MSITKDATKGWARPANASEWTELLSGTGLPNPDHSWDCGEASGNLADDIGSLALNAGGTPLYTQSATGWAGTGVGLDAGTTDGFFRSAGAGPNPATTSVVWLLVGNNSATPSVNRVYLAASTSANGCYAQVRMIASNPKLRINCNGNTADSTANISAGDYIIILRYDHAASVAKVYSTIEDVAATYSAAVTDGNKGLTAGNDPWTAFLLACWEGANAEGLDDTDVATIISRIQSPPAAGVAEDDPPPIARGRVIVSPSRPRSLPPSVISDDSPSITVSPFRDDDDRALVAKPWPRWQRTRVQQGDEFPAPPAPVVVSPPGPTLTAWQANGITGKWIAVIEGYPYLLTDATEAQAIEAWDGTDFTSALHGLYPRHRPEQELNPWEPFIGGGNLTLSVAPDGAVLNGTFGRDTHKAAGNESQMTTSVDCDDTTFVLKSASTFASSGTAYCGSEAISYAGKTATDLTGITRGLNSPFACDPSGSGGSRFSHMHTVATDPNGINLLPQVASHPRPEWWIGKWVGLWRHLIDVGTGLLNTREDAQLCFVGRVAEIDDNADTGNIEVEVEHVLDFLRESATIGIEPYQAKLTEGLSLAPGMKFTLVDSTGAANPLLVKLSGAVAPNEIDAGVYSGEQIQDFVNDWLAAEKVAIRIDGSYSLGLTSSANGTRAVFNYNFEAGDHFMFNMPAEVNDFFGHFECIAVGTQNGFDQIQLREENGATAGTDLKLTSTNVPLRHKHTPNGTFQLEDERNTMFDQGASLPSALQFWANQHGGDRGLFLIDGSLYAAVYTAGSPSTLTFLSQFSPSGVSVGDLNNLQITVDDARGPVEVRQIGAYEDSFGNLLKKIFYSTGTEGYNHATFDCLPPQLCFGGVPGELLGSSFEESIDQLPGADLPFLMLVDKPKKLPDIFGGDLILRWAFLRWINEHLEFRTYTTPLSGTAFSESNKARPASAEDEQRSNSRLLDEYQRNLIKIQYNRDIRSPDNSGFQDVAIVADRNSIDNGGRLAKMITISAANAYAQNAGSGTGIDSLITHFKTVAPLWTRPVRIITRTIDPRFYEGYSVGDVVLVTDAYARDPDTGLRGISARPGLIVKHGYSTGGATPDSDEPADMTGEVKILLRDVLRVAKYVPCAQVDDTQANGGLDAGTLKTFTFYAHKHSESTEAADASHMSANRKVRIIQIDPADPANPLSWDRVIDTQTGNTATVTVAIGSPAWDATKKYRMVFDDYTDALTEQQAGFTFQADDSDGMVLDSRVPYEYAISPHLQFPFNSSYTHNAAADPVELPPNACSADGAGLDIGHMAATNRLTNNLIDYKTAHSKPHLTQTEMSGAAATGTWLLCDIHSINLTPDQNALLLYRKLYVAPHFKSSDGTSASVRISLVRKMPSDNSVNDVTRDTLLAEATFTTTSTTYATPSSSGLKIGNIKDQYGNAFLLIELSIKARCMGLGYCQEGPREGGLVL